MKATPLGKWLVEAWGNKEVGDGDYDFAVFVDVIAEIGADGELSVMKGCIAELCLAKQYGLVTE